MKDYKKRLVEVSEILKRLPQEDYEKIPEWVINCINENKDETYTWHFDETKPFKEQAIDRDTIVILSFVNIEYLLNNEQKQLMEQFYKLNSKKLENQYMKNDGKNLFMNIDSDNVQEQQNNTVNVEGVSVYKENKIRKLINKIKKIVKF